ncbi:hypothetical protein [Bacteroides congonensis]|uniref:hypothetical protein n=2 Tax=Bacteroides TaxID=816 RepID=UPI002665D769|nr:hypothetical protein [Bacteroides congonensis]
MALYAGFHDQIRPLQSGAWRFCREPSGCDLEYKKDMTSTFAIQFSSGSLKVDMQGCGSTPAMGNLQMGLWNKRGLQRKEKISMGNYLSFGCIQDIRH